MQHILFVEDDPLMQRFVAYAIEDEPFTLTCCETVPEAMTHLAQKTFDWILTDLMLPGISGLTFIQRLTERPELAGGAKIVALSAGMNPSVKQQLHACGVFRQLLKPVSVTSLRELLFEASENLPPASPHPSPPSAVESYFSADLALFKTFTELSLTQFQQDIEDGEQSMNARDIAAMHRLAHSLKSVLLLLGADQAHSLALALEQAASTGAPQAEIGAAWAALQQSLEGLITAADK